MEKKLTVLKAGTVFSKPNRNSEIIEELKIYEEPTYNRVMRRNGVTWFEIIAKNGKTGYLVKENAFQWKEIQIHCLGAYMWTRVSRDAQEVKIELPNESFVHIKHPHEHFNDNYLIINSDDVVGEMPPQVTFKEKQWVSFKILFIIIFIAFSIFCIGAMIAEGTIVLGGLVIIFIAAVSFVFTTVVYLSLKYIKSVIYEVKIRL